MCADLGICLFAMDNNYVLVSGSGSVRVFDSTTGKTLNTISGRTNVIDCIQYCADTNMFITGCGDYGNNDRIVHGWRQIATGVNYECVLCVRDAPKAAVFGPM